MDDQTSAGTGTVMRTSTFEGYAKEAGFESVEVLRSSTTSCASTGSIARP